MLRNIFEIRSCRPIEILANDIKVDTTDQIGYARRAVHCVQWPWQLTRFMSSISNIWHKITYTQITSCTCSSRTVNISCLVIIDCVVTINCPVIITESCQRWARSELQVAQLILTEKCVTHVTHSITRIVQLGAACVFSQLRQDPRCLQRFPEQTAQHRSRNS